MMKKLKDLPHFTIKKFLATLPKEQETMSSYMWKESLSHQSQFCEAVVKSGYLKYEQMLSAVCRYRLGATRKGGVIFWQISREGDVYDGKVMYYGPDCHRSKDHRLHPTWVSAMLARRNHGADIGYTTRQCLFGLHLLEPESEVAIVEAEKTAVILSEHYPQYLWMAAGGLSQLQAEKFRPLRGHKIILFPDTDPIGTTHRRWSDIAHEVMQQPFWEGSPPIYVSPLLERRASPTQKKQKIDLVDFLF